MTNKSLLVVLLSVVMCVVVASSSLVSAAPTSRLRELGEYDEEYQKETAKQRYENGQATFIVDPKKTAVLVVDMVDEFVKPKWTPYWVPQATAMVPRLKSFIEFARSEKIPVVFLGYKPRNGRVEQVFYNKGISFVRPEDNRHFAAYYKVESFYEELRPQSGDFVIIKPGYSGFYGTALETLLHNLKIETVIVTGTMTQYCCESTAREAYWRGFNVIFPSNLNTTDDQELHNATLKTLRRGFAMICSDEELKQVLKPKSPR